MSVDIRGILSRLLGDFVDIPVDQIRSLLEVPPDTSFGDYALPCFTLAKILRKNPAEIAQNLKETLESNLGTAGIVSGVEAKGAYLNLFINRSVMVGTILSDLFDTEYSQLRTEGRGKTVVIDYSSPNIAKPFGIGHLRSTVIGHALGNIYRFLGYRVIGINHLGDWGTQFGKLITAFKRWGREEELSGEDPIRYLYELYVRFHSESEKSVDLEDEARNWFNRLESGDSDAQNLWERFKELSLAEFTRIYDRLGVSFDHFTGESFYSDRLDAAIERIEKSGITELSDGALIVPLDDEELPPALLKKSDGSTLYLTRDLAAAFYRYDTFHFDLALYVVGTPQSLHFRQLFRVLEKLGQSWWERCHHVPFGQIRFEDSSMSTRKGNIIFLEEVLDRAVGLALETIVEKNPDLPNREAVAESVGVGAVIFNDLKNSRIRDIVFDWDEIINFNGETGVYLQYTHARACSLLKKYAEVYGTVHLPEVLEMGDEGYALVTHLNAFEETVLRASGEFEPSIIARYLLELASEFNSFYNLHRVISDDAAQSLSRALVVCVVRNTLRYGLELLGIDAVEEM
jgi:arginyl-tRNA synthetase